MEHNHKKLNKYILGTKLGQGGFASVFQFRHIKTGKLFAGKQINKHLKETSI